MSKLITSGSLLLHHLHNKISQGGSADEQVNHIRLSIVTPLTRHITLRLSIVTPLTRHITLIMGRIQYFFNLKNKNKNISQNGVAPRSWKGFSYCNSKYPQSHIVEINKICL